MRPVAKARTETDCSAADDKSQVEAFWGPHQAGITTPAQHHTYVAALDLVATTRDEVSAMLRGWTSAAAAMTGAAPARELAPPAPGSGETQGSLLSRLTLTFGFGAGLFIKNGEDRYGLAAQRPAALVDLPAFNGDELIEARTGGDLSVQACADDPQVAFDAVRHLARLAHSAVQMRWAQAGFIGGSGPHQAPRNLMGFKDGTGNPPVDDSAAMQQVVWVGEEGPDWMRGGSYVVFRRIRMALEHWDRMPLGFQERTFGRHKQSGAPLGRDDEFDAADLTAIDREGDPVIPDSAHIRLAGAAGNDGARILRRGYSYNDGVNFTVERWPPWHRGIEYDAGLLFVCYQRDPRTGFIKVFDKLAKFDMLSQFVTHTGGGLFACPGGVAEGEFIGQRLLTP
jgi:deferrochelatase/peroxidase EfeB